MTSSSSSAPVIGHSGHVSDDVTTGASAAGSPAAVKSLAVLTLIVVASLCAVVGAIYLVVTSSAM